MINDNVVDVQISVTKASNSATRFGHMLIIGPTPTNPGATSVPEVAAYNINDIPTQLKKAGFGETDVIYKAAQKVAIATTPSDVVYIAIQKSAGSGLEDITATMQRAIDYTNDFWAVCPVGIGDADLQKLAEFIETVEPGVFMDVASTKISDTVITGQYERTRVIHQTYDTDYANVGEMAAMLSHAPGSATFQFLNIPGLEAQALTQSEINAMEKNNTACYVSLYGNSCVYGGKTVSGEWADTILFKDWLIDRIQRKVSGLFIKLDKVPYTDAGITMIQSNMISALEEGRTAGGIAEDETDDDGNITPGFTTSVPRGRSLDEAKRAHRVLESCTFEARLAGAIHSVTVRGNLVS